MRAAPARPRPVGLVALLLILATLTPCAGCGRKTAVRPPDLVAPTAITTLAANNVAGGVALKWQRPRESVDGQRLFDLDAFVVERALPGLPFAFLTRVQVPDREKLRQQKRFTFLDESALMGEAYRYRVLATTVDGYFSLPSNVVDIVRREPAPSPTATASPAPPP